MTVNHWPEDENDPEAEKWFEETKREAERQRIPA